MKRIVLLLAVFGLVFGAALQASAEVAVNWGARWDFDLNWQDNLDFQDLEDDGESEDDFAATQRLRMTFEAEASEMLKGVVEFEWGTATWGAPGDNDYATINNDQANTEIRRSFIQFMWPGTDLTMIFGKTSFGLPHAWDTNAIHTTSNRPPLIALNYAFSEEVALNVFWNRIVDTNGSASSDSPEAEEQDAFGFTVPVTLADYGFNIEPYFTYLNTGKDISGLTPTPDENVSAYFFGFAADVNPIDPLTIYFDFMYGSTDTGDDVTDASGYLFDAKIAYALELFTPALVAWYGSGEDNDEDGFETMPIIAGNTPEFTSFAFDGASTGTGNIVSALGAGWVGTWGIGVLLEDIVFIENLTHNLRFVYSKGTSDTQTGGFGVFDEDDSFYEVNFDHSYAIYENLTAFLELGYVDADLEDGNGDEVDTSAALKAAFRIRYMF